MAEPRDAPEQVLSKAKPYNWDTTNPPPAEVIQLWTEVGNGIDTSQTVVWKNAVDTLESALKFLETSEDARHFVEGYAGSIVGILAEQSPGKIGPHERNCVQESLIAASLLVAKDLEIQIERKGECKLIEPVLPHIFSRKKNFYKGSKGVWQSNLNSSSGYPEVRLRNIEKFRSANGFALLRTYMMERVQNSDFVDGNFPTLDTVQHILSALHDSVAPSENSQVQEDDAIQVSKAVMLYLSSLGDDELKKIPADMLNTTIKALQRIYDLLVTVRRDATIEFYAFWRSLVLSMIKSSSLPLKLAGWEQVNELIKAVGEHRPPPRSYIVSGAGSAFVNGRYDFAGATTNDGYAKLGADVSYVRAISDEEPDGAGKKLTLFRCTMRSQQKWWFLSEADEEQPGTDRDIDYYQHKSKEHEEAYPPPGGWITCKSAGVHPPPMLQSQGLLVPPGQEFETLEHQLAKWAIENEIVEQVLGDTTIHREVVSRSTDLIKFLAFMCTRDGEDVMDTGGETNAQPNKYCLQTSHLLFAWKTCTRKADAAVSLQVYQLLVSILPLCPSNRAIPLLKAIQKSLHESSEKRDYLFEVSEFASALAAANLVEANNNKNAAVPGTTLSEDVREEVLNLLWSVLTHPGVSALKTYDSLKRYVTHELRVEPKGSEHRERFLRTCVDVLSSNAEKKGTDLIDEGQALRMVKLTRFILEACPRQQAEAFASAENNRLPILLFNELIASLDRKRQKSGKQSMPSRKSSVSLSSSTPAIAVPDGTKPEINSLEERFKILRYVYGLSDPTEGTFDPITMSTEMLHTLWDNCKDNREDREALLVFIASASHPGKATQYERFTPMVPSMVNTAGNPSEPSLSAAFTEDVCHSVFIDIFCSSSFDYDDLSERGYKSFQFLFQRLRESSCHPDSKKTALDALWKVCLTAGSDSVASQAMKDLLGVYIEQQSVGTSFTENGDTQDAPEHMLTNDSDGGFSQRMFDALGRVKVDLDARAPTAERSAERCMKILNAAIGGVDAEGFTTSPTLLRLSKLSGKQCSLSDATRCLPHGMRGQACYLNVGIIAKRPQTQNQNTSNFEGVSPRVQPAMRFSLHVHPLETLASVKGKVAMNCQCASHAVRPIQINGRAKIGPNDPPHLSLNVIPEDTVMDELGVVHGCEIVFVILERATHNNANAPSTAQRGSYSNDLSAVFFSDDGRFAERVFSTVLSILEALPWNNKREIPAPSNNNSSKSMGIHKLVWELLLAMPTNESVASRVKTAHARSLESQLTASDDDAMEVDSSNDGWSQLLDSSSFDRSVYVLLTIDAFLQPAPEALSILPRDQRLAFEQKLIDEATTFRRVFIDAGGFGAVVKFFSLAGSDDVFLREKTRHGNAVALRILKSCLFGNIRESHDSGNGSPTPDDTGLQLLQHLSDSSSLLKSLTGMVVEDRGISSATITNVLRFLRLLFQTPRAAQNFVTLKNAEKFLVILLMWDDCSPTKTSSSISASSHVRRSIHDLILHTPELADQALPWLISAIDTVDVSSESTSDYFDVLEKLISDVRTTARSKSATDVELQRLAVTVCKKLISCPRPCNETDATDISTGVLRGCLKLLRALIERGGGSVLRQGTKILLNDLGVDRWSEIGQTPSRSVLSIVSSPFRQTRVEDVTLIDLMGAIFDGFLSPHRSSPVAICCDKESRQRGFDVVGAAARTCEGPGGYLALVSRIDNHISLAAPKLRYRWGQFGGNNESHIRGRVSKYSGLRNQGCTCYMNSVLQQLFMMEDLRKSMCAAPIPASLRSVGSGVSSKGADLVGKKISLQWDTGVSYDAVVEAFNEDTGMHIIRYCPVQVASVAGSTHHQIRPEDVARLPPTLPDEFVLSEGRPGKETGVFEIVPEVDAMESDGARDSSSLSNISESEDEAKSRHLLEEVQRTFIHLEEGSRGHCFDPRSLVEACACLKLEFDVWQQNDASEFATKLLDRLEISLKKWAPEHFHYMDHTFGLKQTKQKICKKCGLKSSREEKLLNIDCQIRGKIDINEALAAMTEVEIMEGSNKVYCETCKENTDTILKSAISTLPNMLILSLKRFDLDYATFETVKLNSRCAFGQTLNMKQYSLDAVEAVERAQNDTDKVDPDSMETDDINTIDMEDPLSQLNDEDYEYRLVGVLVHAGVAQGGHYYSFIKDRTTGLEDKWYRFDDEDVTPFDPSSIETECFGGKVKKETKWPNGQVQTVEQEQFANALMLFYEKVKPIDTPRQASEMNSSADIPTLTGYDVFEPDVRLSNQTHQWQSFLFDNEFNSFLKGLLSFCFMSNRDRDADETWRGAVLQMLLSFVFDIMFYSANCSSRLNDWTRMIEELLANDVSNAVTFVQRLARKTGDISGNWLRTSFLECPDQSIRTSSLRIFSSAIKSAITSESEMKGLTAWIRAWREYIHHLQSRASNSGTRTFVMPCYLGEKWHQFDDVTKIGSGSSSIGIILSYVNVMLEALPRCWRFSPELCQLLRNLSTMKCEKGDVLLKRAMVDAQIPLRIIAFIARDRAPTHLRWVCPAACVSTELAHSQMRAEANPNAHVLPLAGNQVMNTNEMNNNRGPSNADYLALLETIACLLGIPGMVHSTLVRETDDRGRQWFGLSEDAVKALSVIFNECCAEGAPGMGQGDIESYLQRSGIDTSGMSSQKILEMLAKYPTTSSGSDRSAYLSLEGFLAYYRDSVHSNDLRLRHDLHTFGFRPDLSRRPKEARFFKIGERETQMPPVQSVAVDVAENFKDRILELGSIANFAMLNTIQLYTVAYDVSEPLMQYLVARATCGRNSEVMVDRILNGMYTAPQNDWEGNRAVSCSVLMLQVIASIPGEDQNSRINQIMNSNSKATPEVPYGSGILSVLHGLRIRQSQQYSNDSQWTYSRYMHVLKEMYNLYPIFKWMNDNRAQWNFIERELLDSNRGMSPNRNQTRVDYAHREQEGVSQLDHNNAHSDSELGCMNDSEEDEDSHYDNLDVRGGSEGPSHISVEEAGNPAVNGVYSRDGFFENAIRYSMDGSWKENPSKFYIFLCNVSNNTKHWYISIVPLGGSPGTSSDIDFYTAPLTERNATVPPRTGWVKAIEGTEPAPKIVYKNDFEGNETPEVVVQGGIVEDDVADEPNSYR